MHVLYSRKKEKASAPEKSGRKIEDDEGKWENLKRTGTFLKEFRLSK
jgi:hypothetical protein